jgi:hypothetical protein
MFRSKTLLLRALLKVTDARSEWVQGYDVQGHPLINRMRARQWLNDLRTLEGMLMAYIEMTSGAPTRGTEMSSMNCANTATSRRHLFMLGPYLCNTVQYHKMRAVTGSNRWIPHAFDAFGSDMTIQIHAIARPFALFLCDQHFPSNLPMRQTYEQALFANFGKRYTSEDLSGWISKLCTPFVGPVMILSVWRHVAIAFQRKHCPEARRLLDSSESDDSVRALQAGHSRQVEERVYGLSATSALNTPEDMAEAMCQASTDWQIVVKVVPGGIHIPHAECLASSFDSILKSGAFVLPPPPLNGVQLVEAITRSVMEEITPVLADHVYIAAASTASTTCDHMLQELIRVSQGEKHLSSDERFHVIRRHMRKQVRGYLKVMEPVINKHVGEAHKRNRTRHFEMERNCVPVSEAYPSKQDEPAVADDAGESEFASATKVLPLFL